MLTQICQEIRNWFDRDLPKWHGQVTIIDGNITVVPDYRYYGKIEPFSLQEGQYFRIIGSLFNDGVHQYPDDSLRDESFRGSVWAMAVPPAVIALASDVSDWLDKYGGVDGALMSPYQSESFGGYSYSKGSGGGSGDGTSKAGTWQGAFATRLNAWRKL